MGYNVYAGNIKVNSGKSTYFWENRTLIYTNDGDAVSGAAESPILIDPTLTLIASDPGSFTFTVPYRCIGIDGEVHTNPYYNTFQTRQTFVSVEEDGVEIFLGYVKTIELRFDQSKEITVMGIMSLFEDAEVLMEPTEWVLTCDENDGMPMVSLFGWFLHYVTFPGDYDAGFPGYFDTVSCDIARGKKINTTEDGWQSMTFLSMIQKYLLDEYGGYFRIDSEEAGENEYRLVIRYTSGALTATKQKIEYGKNLLDLTITEDVGSIVNTVSVNGIATKTKGWWIFKKTTTEYVSGSARDEESQKRYGLFIKQLYTDQAVTNEACQKLAEEELDTYDHFAIPELNIHAYDRADAGVVTDRLGFLKKTEVISAPHDVDGWYLCTKVVLPLAKLDEKEFTYGVPPVKLTKQQNQMKIAQNATTSITRGIVSHLNS